MKLAFIGLGNMGAPMARNLLHAGHQVTVYNRTPSRAKALAPGGARVADSIPDVVRDAEIAITMLADDAAMNDVLGSGFVGALPRGAIHMGMSTTSVELSRQLFGLHDFGHQAFVASPVLGRPEAAHAGKLWLIMAGAAANVERCRPIVDALGRGYTVVGSEPWQANMVKIAMNFTLASMLETLGEAFALIGKSGVDPLRFLDVVKNLYQSPVYNNYGAIIADRQFEPAGFRMKLGLKDVKLALSAAEAENVAMPLASVLRDHFLEGIARGYADRDWSAIAQVLEEHAGYIPLTATKPAGESGSSE